MTRLLFFVALAFSVRSAAFTLIDLSVTPATHLVLFQCQSPAAAAAPEGQDFLPRFATFGMYGLDGGGAFFGIEGWQFDTVTCGWDTAGVVSGGTDVMRIELIQKSDAGVACTCDLPGACSDAAGLEHSCKCSGGTKYLTDLIALLYGYSCQLNTATNCGTNPSHFVCAIPFHY